MVDDAWSWNGEGGMGKITPKLRTGEVGVNVWDCGSKQSQGWGKWTSLEFSLVDQKQKQQEQQEQKDLEKSCWGLIFGERLTEEKLDMEWFLHSHTSLLNNST